MTAVAEARTAFGLARTRLLEADGAFTAAQAVLKQAEFDELDRKFRERIAEFDELHAQLRRDLGQVPEAGSAEGAAQYPPVDTSARSQLGEPRALSGARFAKMETTLRRARACATVMASRIFGNEDAMRLFAAKLRELAATGRIALGQKNCPCPEFVHGQPLSADGLAAQIMEQLAQQGLREPPAHSGAAVFSGEALARRVA